MNMNFGGQDSLDWTPEMAIEAGLEEVRKDPPSAALTILLYNDDGKYDTNYFNSGLSASQAIALLEVAKQRMLKLMDD